MSKKIKEQPKEPPRIYVEYDSSRTGGEPIDPEDRWTSRTDERIEVKFIRLYRQPPQHRFFNDSVDVSEDLLIKDKLFLAVIRYGTGDTFGHTSGAWYIVGLAASYQEAQALLDEETKPSSKPQNGSWPRYKKWEGYFESLEDTEIHELSLV